MGEVPLARMWHLPDGTSCLLLKDSRTENWELRVIRENAVLRTERFGNAIVAMNEAKQWRASFDSSRGASH
jgi:hypothetical protein